MTSMFSHQTYWIIIVAVFCLTVATGAVIDYLRARRLLRRTHAMAAQGNADSNFLSKK